MAKGASARAAARRQKDKWKAKRWYSIRAPRNPWSFKIIGETIAEEESMLLGRTFEIMQNELDGDFTKMHVKIQFRVKEVVGNDALTEYVGHDVMKDFVRRQIRRDRGKIDDSIDVVTDDGFFIRIKPFIVTRSRVKASQKQETRSSARNVIIQFCSKSTWISIQKALMDGSLEEAVTKEITKIQPVRSVIFRRSQLMQDGVIIDDGPTLEEIKKQEQESKKESENQDEGTEEGDLLEHSETIEEARDQSTEDSENESVESKDDSIQYESMTVPQLKELLKEAGKTVSGKKSELISRLQE
ncbi:MAG: hypothetical protein CMA12_03355 [Euryarchaeota archaeon]|nr:hypothetical protein [Euryarchaeota archaeon]OUW22528.1 MAG: hypothetical protein CBD33_01700 [Euryarchaeota archaeon TMED173]